MLGRCLIWSILTQTTVKLHRIEWMLFVNQERLLGITLTKFYKAPQLLSIFKSLLIRSMLPTCQLQYPWLTAQWFSKQFYSLWQNCSYILFLTQYHHLILKHDNDWCPVALESSKFINPLATINPTLFPASHIWRSTGHCRGLAER
jgi:hypothetical protein